MKFQSIAPVAIKVVALAFFAVATFSSANAAQFGVRVVDEAGMPVSGASVCFGLPGSYRQFGAHFTDADGQAMSDVPNLPFVVTVSKTRFSGVRLAEPARGFNLIKQVTLVEGFPGPRCKAGSTLAESEQSSIHISRVDVTSMDGITRLTPIAIGMPTDYRISATPSFDSGRWRAFDETIQLPSAFNSQQEIYLQLRRYEETSKGWLEAISRPVTVFLPYSSTLDL